MANRRWGTRGYCTTPRCTNQATADDGLCDRHAGKGEETGRRPQIRGGTLGICRDDACSRPVKCRGLCQMHYDRERAAHRTREDKVLPTRARHRALAALVEAHRDEFRELYDQALEDVAVEAEELRALAEAQGVELADQRRVFRLKRGPAGDDQDVLDRIHQDQGHTCSACSRVHDRGHACPECGTTVGMPVERDTSKPEIRQHAKELVKQRASELDEVLDSYPEIGERYRVRLPPDDDEKEANCG
jgi:rubrerythrin